MEPLTIHLLVEMEYWVSSPGSPLSTQNCVCWHSLLQALDTRSLPHAMVPAAPFGEAMTVMPLALQEGQEQHHAAFFPLRGSRVPLFPDLREAV